MLRNVLTMLSIVLLISCAELQTINRHQATGLGVGTGILAGKTIERAKEVFTPQYDLREYPSELCEPAESIDTIKCVIVPCELENEGDKAACEVYMSFAEFWGSRGPVEGIDTTSKKTIEFLSFCEHYPDRCKKILAKYKGKTIIFY